MSYIFYRSALCENQFVIKSVLQATHGTAANESTTATTTATATVPATSTDGI